MKCKQLTGKLFTTVYDKGRACMRVRVCMCVCACVFTGKGAALPAPQARSCVVM